jgi:hypothetical protein
MPPKTLKRQEESQLYNNAESAYLSKNIGTHKSGES